MTKPDMMMNLLEQSKKAPPDLSDGDRRFFERLRTQGGYSSIEEMFKRWRELAGITDE